MFEGYSFFGYTEADTSPPESITLNENTFDSVGSVFPERIQAILLRTSVKYYLSWSYALMFLSVSLILSLVYKIIFNYFSKRRILYDKWTVFDTLSAVSNIIAILIIRWIDPVWLMDNSYKDMLDYYMLLVLTLAWIRFISFFLVISFLSKMILTLFQMITDTTNFIVVVLCYLVLFSAVFTTLYQDYNYDKYGNLKTSVVTLFDAILAAYDYDGLGGRTTSHTILLILHILMGNILFLNYMIAILSTAYENMRESGIFVYKKNLYQYCDKYIKAFEDEAYGELITHSPPFNYLNLIALPFIFSRTSMKYFSKTLSYFIFWLDNICIWMNLFLILEIIISPFVLLKLFFSLFSVIKKMQKRLQYMAMFTVGFPIVFIYVLSIDFRNLFFIMRCHKGCKTYYKVKDEIVKKEYSDSLKIQVFNEIRCTLINLFSRLTDN